MPKFNEFIKGFEEKAETEQPKVEAPKAERGDTKKGGFAEEKPKPLGLKSFSDTADVDTAYGVLNIGEWKFGGDWGEKQAYDFLKNNNRKLPYTDDQLHQISKEWVEWKEAERNRYKKTR